MVCSGVGTLLIGALVAFQVGDSRGLAPAEVQTLVALFERAIGDRVGDPPVVFPERRTRTCGDAAQCLERLRAQSGADEVVLMRAAGAPTRVRLIVELAVAGRRTAVDLPRDTQTWGPIIRGLVEGLIPKSGPPPPPAIPSASTGDAAPPVPPAVPDTRVGPGPPAAELTASAPEDAAPVWPWLSASGGVLAGAAAAVLYALATSEYDDYQSVFETRGYRDEALLKSANGLAAASIGLGTTTIVAGALAVYGFVADSDDEDLRSD